MTTDPTREEMIEFLASQGYLELPGDNVAGIDVDCEEALYWYAANNHLGQGSNLYSVLSSSEFVPSRLANGCEPDSMAALMYTAISLAFIC